MGEASCAIGGVRCCFRGPEVGLTTERGEEILPVGKSMEMSLLPRSRVQQMKMKEVEIEPIHFVGQGIGRSEDEGHVHETVVLCDSVCGLQAMGR